MKVNPYFQENRLQTLDSVACFRHAYFGEQTHEVVFVQYRSVLMTYYIHSLVALVTFFTHILTRFIPTPTPLNGSHSLLLRVICCVRYSDLNEERGQECKWVGKQEEVISLHSISVSQHCIHFVSVGSIQHFQRQVPCI